MSGPSSPAAAETPATDPADRRRGEFLVLAAAGLFSTGGAVLKVVALPNWHVVGGRTAIAAVAMLAFVPAARRGFGARTFLVGVPYAATLMLFAFATRLTTAANAIFLQSTAPLYLLILSPWLLRERIRGRDVAYMGALAVGLALLLAGRVAPRATAPDPVLGNVLGLASGITWALAVAGLRWLAKDAPDGSRAAAAAVAGNVYASILCLPFVLPAADAFVSADAGDWAGLVYLGVVQVAAAYAFLIRGVRRVPAFEASLLLLVEPVLNPVWAWVVLGEAPGALALGGGAVIVVATAVHTRR